MAEHAANFTSTFENKPSIFEVIAQKSLHDTLYPAFQKIALYLSTHSPQKFGFLNVYFEESFAVLNGALQLYYLKYYDSSFSENFYGLKRVMSGESPLMKHQKELSLLFLVVVPYFKRKIEERLQIYRIEHAEGYLRKDFEGRSKRFLIYSHSAFEVIWGLITLNNYLQYMGNKTEFQEPLLKLLGLKLVYSNDQPSKSFWSSLFSGKLGFSDLSFASVRGAVSTIFETTAFFLQLLQTWNAHNPNYNITDLPRSEAPLCDNRAETYGGKCPICLQKWLIPAALPVSGYIFCFKCILNYLVEHQKCPVTKLAARPTDVVRLYVD
ncbi:peroxisome assembly protein 12 [Anthonomus grandis grandis]|uniref:peroxisome assembly protein 12 n=1 Tax=Anthonomus grandis grandis TaxID=2921223 RepID=UPI0021662BC5|nr:peroxisome assembly protein 12 [Anthonomus grandis grandis]